MLFRRFETSDAGAVQLLHEDAMRHAGALIPGPWDADLQQIPEQYLDKRGEFLVGEMQGQIVGMGAFRFVDGNRAEMQWTPLSVTPFACAKAAPAGRRH